MEQDLTTMQIEKETLEKFNKRKYEAIGKKGKNITNNEFLLELLSK